jgi:hypothetical protein
MATAPRPLTSSQPGRSPSQENPDCTFACVQRCDKTDYGADPDQSKGPPLPFSVGPLQCHRILEFPMFALARHHSN